LSATSRAARNAALAKLAGNVGTATAANRARRLFASAARKDELDTELQLRTAEQVAASLGNMKGALMKIGQLASFLDDAMPEPVRQALAQLQQNAPPMSAALCAEVVRDELGQPPEQLFAQWDDVPIAAASIGQVHRAVTRDDRAVAVKVQYPGVQEAVRADLANLDLAGMGLGSLFPGLDADALVAELRLRLSEELDYTTEAENQRFFARRYRGHPFISVPEVVDELSTRRVLTTDLAVGARFDDMETWPQAERDLAAETIFRFVFRSLYRFHAFNGDPHPGNYLFRPGGRVTFVDFGLVKYLSADEVAMCFDLVRSSVVAGDPAAMRRACERAGLIAPGAPVPDERVAEFMGIFWEAVLHDEVTTITAEWASQVARRYVEGRTTFADVMAHAGMPPSLVVLQRINLGLLAILGRLEATANWRRVAEELWPTDEGPSTLLGLEEAEWWDRARQWAVPIPVPDRPA
jgi:predicted unusual protein kinase regulating ubiquinone biosynthesis (AarF/ABC1/UbiB family)